MGYIMLLFEDSSVLLQATVQVGLVCVEGCGAGSIYWVYLQCMLLCISYGVRSCV